MKSTIRAPFQKTCLSPALAVPCSIILGAALPPPGLRPRRLPCRPMCEVHLASPESAIDGLSTSDSEGQRRAPVDREEAEFAPQEYPPSGTPWRHGARCLPGRRFESAESRTSDRTVPLDAGLSKPVKGIPPTISADRPR